MENIELIDKYLSGRMSDGEMMEFEQTLSADPLLNKDFEFQQAIVEGVKTARVNELKASLNAIDVSGLTSTTSFWSVKTITAATIIIVGGVTSYFMLNKTSDNDNTSVAVEESINNNKNQNSEVIIPTTITEVISSGQEEKTKVIPQVNVETTESSNQTSKTVDTSFLAHMELITF